MKRIILLALGLAMLLFANGCLKSKLDDNWGNAHRQQIASQTANPDAPSDTEPLESLDPETGKRVAERYYKGQEKQKQRIAPTVTIQGNK